MYNNKSVKSLILFASLTFLFLFTCNLLLPPLSDDLEHAEIAQRGLEGGIEQYITTNARFGQFMLCSFAAALPPVIYDLVNAILGAVFIFLLFILIEGRLPNKRSDYGEMSFILICILMATMFGSVFLWVSGALNYLWAYILIALHWLPYRLYYKHNCTFSLNVVQIGLLFLVSILAGWCSEQVGIISILVHIVLLSFGLLKRQKFPMWYWGCIVLFIVGYLILFMSPGLSSRGDSSTNYLSISGLLSLDIISLIKRVVLTIGYSSSKISFDFLMLLLAYTSLNCTFNKKWIVWLIIGIMSCLFALLKLDIMQIPYFYFRILMVGIGVLLSIYGLIKRKHTLLSIIFLIYFIALLSTIQIIGHIPERAKFAQSMLLITMCIYLIKEYVRQLFSKKVIHVIAVFCALFVAGAYVDYRLKHEKMKMIVEESVMRGEKSVVIPHQYFYTWYGNYGDWGIPGADPYVWPNTSYAHYYSLETFKVK